MKWVILNISPDASGLVFHF